MKQAVLFDLDGTLLDTLEDLAASMNAVLLSLGHPPQMVPAYRYFVGEGIAKLVQRALPAGTSAAEQGHALELMRVEYLRRMYGATQPYRGVPELLDGLLARGSRLAILSNKPDGAVRELVDRYFPRIGFQSVYGQRPEVPRKPDPAGALAIAREMGLLPQAFVYLGDSGVDMLTAKAAEMRAVGALWGFRDEEELREAGAEILIKEPIDLLNHME